MNIFDAIHARRAIKHYDPTVKISDDDLAQLKTLIRQSPTSFNTQNWRFVIADDDAVKQKLCAAAWNQKQVTDASHVFILCADVKAWEKSPERYWDKAPKEVQDIIVPMIKPFYDGRDWQQRDEAMRSIGIAAQTLMLSAKAMGYDTCPMIGFDADAVADIINLPDDHVIGSPRLRAAGIPAPNVEIQIIDRQGKAVPQGEVGEIIIKTPACMLEYWQFPEATQKTLIDDFIHSGDAGYFDEDGYLYIFDRVKDMIISGGENIYPIEVENALYNHDAVTDAAVIGTPDEKWGEAVTAIVVLGEGKMVSDQALIDHCRQQIASYKCPKKVIFIDELPRNASGKILKKDLRKPYWKNQPRQV